MEPFDQERNLYALRRLKQGAERAMLVFLCAIGVLGLVLLTINLTEINKQNRELGTALKAQQTLLADQEAATARHDQFLVSNSKQIDSQTNQIESYLLCLGDFFAQPDRTNLTITNLQECKFNVNAFNSTTATVPAGTSTSSTPPAKEPTTSEPPEKAATAAPVGQTTGTHTSTSTGSTVAPGGTTTESFLAKLIAGVKRLL